MTEMFGEAWSPMSVPDLAPDDDDDTRLNLQTKNVNFIFFDLFYLHSRLDLHLTIPGSKAVLSLYSKKCL